MVHVFQLSSFDRHEEPVKQHANTNGFDNTLTRDTGILSPELLQRRMSLEELRSRESSLKSSILVRNPLPRDNPHHIGGGTVNPGSWNIYIYIVCNIYK